MEEQIRELLLKGVDTEKLVSDLSSHFTEKVEDSAGQCPDFQKKMESFATLSDLFHAPQGALTKEEALLSDDLYQDIDYAVMYEFDVVEDSVKREILHGDLKKGVFTEMRQAGIVPMEGNDYSEDDVEEFYLSAFKDFDAVRERLEASVLSESPSQFFQQGRQAIENYRLSHGLSMDERDFNQYYDAHLDTRRMHQIFAKKVYESIHYHRHYVLEFPDEDDGTQDSALDSSGGEESAAAESYSDPDEEPDDTEDALDQELEEEGILISGPDMKPEDFSYVYELMNEYNGHRILPSDTVSSMAGNAVESAEGQGAYWETFGDEFGELLGTFMITNLENTIAYFSEKRPADYASLANLYGWSQKDRTDPEVILRTCDKISFHLADLQQQIWDDFCELPIGPVYEEGKTLSDPDPRENFGP